MKLYIDIDGVLLGKYDGVIQLSYGAKGFIDYALMRFDCYWLTTHCRGCNDSVLRYLGAFVDDDLLNKIKEVKPTNFNVLKTESLNKDDEFIWIEDEILYGEFKWLEQNSKLESWYEVNTYKNFHDLERCLDLLKKLPNVT